jgi:cell division protein FtsB
MRERKNRAPSWKNSHSCLLKNIKVKGLRAAYSTGDQNVDKYSEKLAGGMSQVRVHTKRMFPLDHMKCEACTYRMTGWNNADAKMKNPGAVVRLFERSRVGWRKVATGAAALLALAMGYHVVFGQNGLTAYQQKRQDTQSLDRQMRSLQKENEQLKGHVERLKSDPNAIEHQAREELHYTRPGEVIYTLPANSGSPAIAAEPSGAKQ